MEYTEFYEMVVNSLNGVINNITNSEDWKRKDNDARYSDIMDGIMATINEIESDYPEEVAYRNGELDDEECWYDDVRNDIIAEYFSKYC